MFGVAFKYKKIKIDKIFKLKKHCTARQDRLLKTERNNVAGATFFWAVDNIKQYC